MDSKVGEMFNLAGRTAVVTGGAGNLGSEYVRTLVQAGANVAVFDISDKKNSKLEELLKSGPAVKIYKADLTKKDEVEKALAEASRELGVPTILINNAGLGSRPDAPASENGPFEDYPEESWNAMLDSHLKGMFFTSQAFIRNFRRAQKTSGSIVNVSST
ncbi:MAG: SDR family oxidoreductase, partial [Patescibacteria group bacterium]